MSYYNPFQHLYWGSRGGLPQSGENCYLLGSSEPNIPWPAAHFSLPLTPVTPKLPRRVSHLQSGPGSWLAPPGSITGCQDREQSPPLMQLELELGPQLGSGSHSLIYCIRYLFCTFSQCLGTPQANCCFLFLSLCVCVWERDRKRERYISEPQARLRSFQAAKECKIPEFH